MVRKREPASSADPIGVYAKAKKGDYAGVVLIAMIGAISLTIGIFWAEVIKDIFRSVFPKSSIWLWQLFSAVVLTLLGSIVIYILAKYV
jgi:hypothetical protein